MELEKLDDKKIDDIYNALRCRDLYMWECMGEKCPYYTDKYMPIERCDVIQLREDFKNMVKMLHILKKEKENG